MNQTVHVEHLRLIVLRVLFYRTLLILCWDQVLMFYITRCLLVGLSMLSSSFSFVDSARDAKRAVSSSCCLSSCCWITVLLLAKMYFTKLLEPRSRSSSLTPGFKLMPLLSAYCTSFRHIVDAMLNSIVRPPYSKHCW